MYLSVDVGELCVYSLADYGPPLAGEAGHLTHGEGAVPVGGGQVLRNLGVHAKILSSKNMHKFFIIPSESVYVAGIIIFWVQVAAATFLKIELKFDHF